MAQKTTAPTFPTSLINEPQQNPPGPNVLEGPMKHLIGTWRNQNLPNTQKGGTGSPYSYFVMPLPEKNDPPHPGYILKNTSYYEELTFSPIAGKVTNRGGAGTQVANTLFYEQRVYFAEGPCKNALVHAENGSLLFLTDEVQNLGPYGPECGGDGGSTPVPGSTAPTQKYSVVKQSSVPHGNSILAVGNYTSGSGNPDIPTLNTIPKNISTEPYTEKSVGNPNTEFTKNPNKPLSNALTVSPVERFFQINVATENGTPSATDNGRPPVTNIGFLQKHANVTGYTMTYWLEHLKQPHSDKTEISSEYCQLQYSQTIFMELLINGEWHPFLHVTANTLTKVAP